MTDPSIPTPPPVVSPAPPQNTPPASRLHVVSIIAIITAAVGFIFACIPGALIVGWILLPAAFVLSIVALILPGKKWAGITGLIVAVVGTIVGFVVFFAVVAGAASDAFNTSRINSGTSAPAATESAGGTAADPNTSPFTVTIGEATQTTDFEGKPVIVVRYTFTNNTEEDASFLFTARAQAFQDGIELNNIVFVDEPTPESQNAMKDIKPGTSIEVDEEYLLSGTSDVTVEVTDQFSFDDTVVATKVFTVG